MKTLSQKLSIAVFVMATVLSSMVNAMTPQEAKVAFLEMQKDHGARLVSFVKAPGPSKNVHVDYRVDNVRMAHQFEYFRGILAEDPVLRNFMKVSSSRISEQEYLLDRRIETAKALGRNLALKFDVFSSWDGINTHLTIKWKLIDKDSGKIVSAGERTDFGDKTADDISTGRMAARMISQATKALNREIARLERAAAINKDLEIVLERMNGHKAGGSQANSMQTDRHSRVNGSGFYYHRGNSLFPTTEDPKACGDLKKVHLGQCLKNRVAAIK